MRKLSVLLMSAIVSVAVLFSSCKGNDNDIDDPTKTVNVVSQFVYDGMSLYYLWSSEMEKKQPRTSDSIPAKYFESVLSATDVDHGWSFITDDVQSLMAEFAGTPKEFGFSLVFAYANSAQTEYYAIVKYVFPNSPAYNAGIRRNSIITKIDGKAITLDNYSGLYGNNAIAITLSKFVGNQLITDKEVAISPSVLATNPVLYTEIYEIGGKKIAYLFYTDFISNYNSSLYEAFSRFKQAGVTDLVLDLRYNHGGAVTAATYLASLIAPRAVVESKSPYARMSYNKELNAYFDEKNISRTDSLGVYAADLPNPLGANLNLNKVYIIATNDSYSASELTTFCLKAYMNVVHIGGNTGGKYTASWTIHPYDDEIGVPIYEESKLSAPLKTKLENWAMQPIVAKYTNKNDKDFSTPGYLVPDHALVEGFGYLSAWTQIGDTKDVLLGQALYLITGDASFKPSMSAAPQRMRSSVDATARLKNPKERRSESVLLDNVKLNHEAVDAIFKSKKAL